MNIANTFLILVCLLLVLSIFFPKSATTLANSLDDKLSGKIKKWFDKP